VTLLWEYLALAPVLLGAVLQRVTGLGFALVAAPALVLLFGPDDGVLFVNLCGIVAAGSGVVLDGRRVEWRRAALLVPAAALGVAVGVAIALPLDHAVLEIVVGSILLLGLLTLILLRSRPPSPDRRRAAVGAGVGAGIASALAGLPGPPLAIYAGITGWRGPTMSATLQVVFLTTATAAVVGKLVTGSAGLPTLPSAYWLAAAAALLVGIAVGHVVAPRVSRTWAWRLVVAIALVGSIAAIAQGVLGLLGGPSPAESADSVVE